MQDWEKGGTEVTSQAVTFGKPGDFIKGTYTGKKIVAVKRDNKMIDTPLYEVKASVGNYHEVDSKKNPKEPAVIVVEGSYYNVWGNKDAIDSLFNKSKFGDIVSVQLVAEHESKTAGNAPWKEFKIRQYGTDPEYGGEDSNAMEAKVEEAGI